MSDTPKYAGILSSDDGEFLFTDTPESLKPTRDELESYLNYECSNNHGYGEKRIAELYIRERDTRRQFSPEQLATLRDKLWTDHEIHVTDVQTRMLVDIVLEEYRKLMHEP